MPSFVSRAALALVPAAGLLAGLAAAPVPPDAADPKPAAEARKAAAAFRLPQGVAAHLFAAEPLLANPVAFALDEKGRCYVAETYRHSDAATDNRRHMNWLDDELASRTVADRVAVYRRYLKEKFADYEKPEDRVKLVVDSDGDGTADKATVFAGGFRAAEAGIGAGLLARKGNVYYTCIPDLWRLRDTKGDGVADVRESLSTGYGVHVAFIGHDLHGLRVGPDGRLYFTIGDRGLNVVTKEGKTLALPDTGAVLRCELDGSRLELFATGLRNPQELAFDDRGNLFTGENNSDSGDKARWVYLVDGSDSGWRLGYQYGTHAHWGTPLGNRGPWNSEKIWGLPHPGQPAYVVPPVAHIGNGPSGLCYHPGVAALPGDQAGRFYLVDFTGGSGGSGVWSLGVRPKGAGFELADAKRFVWGVLATDAEVGPDGGLYVSDWVEGWNKTGKGRIWRLADEKKLTDPAVVRVKELLAGGIDRKTEAELARLLAHPDMRVRQEAQFALASRDAVGVLAAAASRGATLHTRLHGVWGLGQVARRPGHVEAGTALAGLLADPDPEVRAQAATAVGDVAWGAPKGLVKLLADPEPRVRLHAALALARLAPEELRLNRAADLAGPVLAMLRANDDREPLLRHAGAVALAALGDGLPDVAAKVAGESVAVRRAVVVALRRQASPAVARFLDDPDPSVVTEAARAIGDLPIDAALPELAKLIDRSGMTEALGFRVLNAHFRLGKPENAAALARFAARGGSPDVLRAEAVEMLGSWARPGRRDRVTGLTMSLPPRDAAPAAAAFRDHLAGLFAAGEDVRKEAVKAATALGVKEVGPVLLALVGDAAKPAGARAEALAALAALKDARAAGAAEAALKSDAPPVRAAARRALARLTPEAAVPHLADAAESATTPERQAALADLALIESPAAQAVLAKWADRLAAGDVPPELRLDAREAVALRPALKSRLAKSDAARTKGDPLAEWRDALAGGDAARGRDVFLNKSAVACQRCHKVEGQGGEVGPELTGVGAQHPREYLLEAIVLPNKAVAKGFESVLLQTSDGKTVAGVLKGEDEKEVRLVTAEGRAVAVPKAEIEERTAGPSAMPADLAPLLSKREMRDLVEFLASLKGGKK